MSARLIQKVRQAVVRHRMLDRGDGVVVAVSGGPDSVALLAILCELSAEYGLRLVAAHLNHGLRPGPADAEEAFVHRLGERFGVICESTVTDVASLSRRRKTSIEETARYARYRFLDEIRGRYQARRIALGHHAWDQAETVLMNLLRGSGGDGLKGMQPVHEDVYIRPLLGINPAEIDAYLKSRALPFLTDLSNADERYLRNRIRHRLMPELKARFNPRLEENLCRTAEIFRQEDDYFGSRMAELFADPDMVRADAVSRQAVVHIGNLRRLHEALQRRFIKHLLLWHAQQTQGIGYVHIRNVQGLMQDAHRRGALHLPFGTEVRREEDRLIIDRRTKPPRGRKSLPEHGRTAPADSGEPAWMAGEVPVPGRIPVPPLRVHLLLDFVDRSAVRFGDGRTMYLDYAAVMPPLTLRLPRPGDRIQPLGMSGSKTLKAYFIDRKVPAASRRQIPILADRFSVVWIVGHQLSERVKITDKTTEVLRIRMTEII